MEIHQGSSSGTGNSEDRQELQVKAYVKVDDKQEEGDIVRTPVMVSISNSSRMAKERAPIDVVLVLHVNIRCMAPANWHVLLNEATKLVIEKLGVDDRLAIVPALLKETRIIFEDAVIVPVKPKLLPMSSENKEAASNSVASSEAMRSNTPLARDLESAESILYGRRSDEKESRAGYIIVISNSNEDMSSVLTWRFRSVHAFGFRDAHNARTMYTIASSPGSTYAIFDEGGQITEAFAASIDKITSAIEPVEIKLKCNQEVVLSAIRAPRVNYFISYDKKIGIIWADAQAQLDGAANNFIFYLDIPIDYFENEYSDLLNVEVKYGHPPKPHKLKGPRLDAVRRGMYGSKEVAGEIVRMEAVKMVADITAEDKDDSEVDANMLHDRWSKLVKESNCGREADEEGLISRLTVEMQEMEARLHNNYLWLEYMLSWRSHQWWPLPPLTMDKKTATIKDPLLQLKLLAKVDTVPEPIQNPQRSLPVLVHIMVPVEGIAKEKRAPLDLVAVLEVSCGGKETKMRRLMMLNKAMGLVMEKLNHNDRLAIIPVHSPVIEPAAALLQMTKEGRSEHTKVLSIMTSTRKATQQLLDDRQAGDKGRMGFIIVISDDSGDISIRQRTLSSNYTIHAFSFRGADNTRAMYHIASCSGGIYAIVDDDRDKITEAFMSCISKITSTIVMNTKVNIMCSPSSSLKLSTIESGQFNYTIDHRRKSGSIFAGSLHAGAVKRFIAYLENVGEDDYGHLSEMLSVNITWQHASNRVVEKLDGQVVTVRDENDGSTEVVEEIVRMQEVRIISAITDPEIQKDSVLRKVQELRKRLIVQAADVRVRPKDYSYAVAVDDESLANLVQDRDGSWLSYLLSWLSFQGLCEKPPLAPSRRRHEMGGSLMLPNLPQTQE
ncbi:hypothetical protein ACP70R_009166 [Stipagrostis hirtigluma subsp. patula]